MKHRYEVVVAGRSDCFYLGDDAALAGKIFQLLVEQKKPVSLYKNDRLVQSHKPKEG